MYAKPVIAAWADEEVNLVELDAMNKTFGGRSPAGLHPGVDGARAAPHGKFMENHGCTWDPRPTTVRPSPRPPCCTFLISLV